MKTIIIDGIEYNLIPTTPQPKFNLLDAIQHSSPNSQIHCITGIAGDRYFVNHTNDYIQFNGQDQYTKVGIFTLTFKGNKHETID